MGWPLFPVRPICGRLTDPSACTNAQKCPLVPSCWLLPDRTWAVCGLSVSANWSEEGGLIARDPGAVTARRETAHVTHLVIALAFLAPIGLILVPHFRATASAG